jgi:hypothetical protein
MREGSKGRLCGKAVKKDFVVRELRKTVWEGKLGRLHMWEGSKGILCGKTIWKRSIGKLCWKGVKEDGVGRE